MLKALVVINRVAEHGLFSCTFNFIDDILRYPVDHHSYVASCFRHQFGGLSSIECATSVYPQHLGLNLLYFRPAPRRGFMKFRSSVDDQLERSKAYD